MGIIKAISLLIRAFLTPRLSLAAENLALRQQLAILRQSAKRRRLRPRDRMFWVWLSCLWPGWRSVLVIVKPETVIRWHRRGFKVYWRWKSRAAKVGRPKIDLEIRDLIRRMSRENPTWGAPRIQSELSLLGHVVAEGTVAKYMVRGGKPPSQTWRTFLDNHVQGIAAVDFFTVPTATFRILFCFLVVRHDRRKVVHFRVTAKRCEPGVRCMAPFQNSSPADQMGITHPVDGQAGGQASWQALSRLSRPRRPGLRWYSCWLSCTRTGEGSRPARSLPRSHG
jgi:hypothetical protein